MLTTNSQGDLMINLSQLLGYNSIIRLPKWKAGANWQHTINNKKEELAFHCSFKIPYSQIYSEKEAKQWFSFIPDKVHLLLIKNEGLFTDNWIALYLILSKNIQFCFLLESNPLLFAIITKKACNQKWEIKKLVNVLSSKREIILFHCKLPAKLFILKTIKRIYIHKLTSPRLKLINQFLTISSVYNFNHIRYFNEEIITLLLEHPHLSKAPLLIKSSSNILSIEGKILFEDILRLLEYFAVNEPYKIIMKCKSFTELNWVHKRLHQLFHIISCQKLNNITISR